MKSENLDLKKASENDDINLNTLKLTILCKFCTFVNNSCNSCVQKEVYVM